MRDTENDNPLLEVARSFRPRILAERDPIEASRRLPEDLARDLAHAGFFRIFLPGAYGGLDLTPMEAMEVFEELARADVQSSFQLSLDRRSSRLALKTTLPLAM
jgi:alkylation response protein AidB-like acyl-CoA dehydrogenase